MRIERFRPQAESIAAELDLTLHEFVGAGAFKETYRATTREGDVVALKVFDPATSDIARAEREVEAMKLCSCSHLARLYDLGRFESGGGGAYIYMTEEYLDGGTLAEALQRETFSAQRIRGIGRALCKALAELDRHSLVHRDIKPDNVMLRAGTMEPVLVDLGLVRNTSRTSLTPSFLPSGPGTPFFAAPEQLNNEKAMIDWRTDQFCLGLVLGICLSGHHPFMDGELSPGEVIAAVASRRTCSPSFERRAVEAGLGFICRMISPWPVLRFPTPKALDAAMKGDC